MADIGFAGLEVVMSNAKHCGGNWGKWCSVPRWTAPVPVTLLPRDWSWPRPSGPTC